MLMQEEREQIVEYGKKMSADRLTSGTSGNISIYNAEKGYMAISFRNRILRCKTGRCSYHGPGC